jgi:hypothetical protein
MKMLLLLLLLLLSDVENLRLQLLSPYPLVMYVVLHMMMDMQTSTWIATEVVSAKNVTAIASNKKITHHWHNNNLYCEEHHQGNDFRKTRWFFSREREREREIEIERGAPNSITT